MFVKDQPVIVFRAPFPPELAIIKNALTPSSIIYDCVLERNKKIEPYLKSNIFTRDDIGIKNLREKMYEESDDIKTFADNFKL
jgi:hypothetical protein